MVVSPGDWNHWKVLSRSQDRGLEYGSAVHKTEDSIPNARNLVVVEEAKIEDGGGHHQNYPRCYLTRKDSQSNTKQWGVADGKRGMIKDREQNDKSFPGDHRIMHNTAGITRLSRLCPL